MAKRRSDSAAVEARLEGVSQRSAPAHSSLAQRPKEAFRPQVDGDLIDDGVCGLFIADKLGVSQPTVSEHLRVLTQAGMLRGKRIKQWTFYKRDEERIAALQDMIVESM